MVRSTCIVSSVRTGFMREAGSVLESPVQGSGIWEYGEDVLPVVMDLELEV